MNGKTHWLHVTSNEMFTHYRVTVKRGEILEDIKNICVHRAFKPYFKLANVQHALCNAHHLRELKAAAEIDKEPWALKMIKLFKIIARYKQFKKNIPVKWITDLYNNIVKQGLEFHQNQTPLTTNGRKKRPGHNLLIRLQNFKDDVLRCLKDHQIPFSNNQAEQDIRMIKVRQKISGCFRSFEGATNFCLIRGFISSCRKQGKSVFEQLYSLS